MVNLVRRAEEYPYSTLNGLLGKRTLLIPIIEDTKLFSGVEQTLNWLNGVPPPEKIDAVK